ncbi:hypothetical protein BST61_g4996 [Cercospora zeina]
MADNSEATQCGVCAEDVALGDVLPIGKDNDKICMDCFLAHMVPKFQAALRTEGGWNDCRWAEGEPPLEARQYADILGADFLARFEEKEKEYRTPGRDRFYCQHPISGDGTAISSDEDLARIERIMAASGRVDRCGAFVGSKASLSSELQVQCGTCSGIICPKCKGLPIYDQKSHKCVAVSRESVEDADAFAGLVVGKDFQYCPGCRSKYMLSEGCNSVYCRNGACGKSFCVLCGQEAAHNSQHWVVGNVTGCTKFGRPGEGGTFDTLQILQDAEADSECVVLDITDFKENFAQTYRQSPATQDLAFPWWFDDPKISDEWIVVCAYAIGPEREPFSGANIWFNELKEGQEMTISGYFGTDSMARYFLAWPERLRQTLIAAAARAGLNTLTMDEAFNLRRPDVDIFRDVQILATRQNPDYRPPYTGVHMWKFLRSIEVELRGRGTSLEDRYPWTADLPASCIVWWRSTSSTRDFGHNDTARFNNVMLHGPEYSLENHAALQKFERLILRNQARFNAFVWQYCDEHARGKQKAAFQTSYAYGAFTVLALQESVNSLREAADAELQQTGTSVEGSFAAQDRFWQPDWLTNVPSNALVVVRYRKPGASPKGAFAETQIFGFDGRNGDLSEHYQSLSRLQWYYDGSSRRFDCLIAKALQLKIEPAGLLVPFDPESTTTFIPSLLLRNDAMRAHVMAIEYRYRDVSNQNTEMHSEIGRAHFQLKLHRDMRRRYAAAAEKHVGDEEIAADFRAGLEKLEQEVVDAQKVVDEAEAALKKGLEYERRVLQQLLRQDEEAMEKAAGR